MIKPILANPISRKFIATTMFATAVLGAGALGTAAQTSKTHPQQVELVSKDAASALQAHSFTIEPPQVSHNRKLDRLYIKNCEQDKTAKYKRETLNAIYNVYGTYGATIEIQRNIDDHFFNETLDKYLEHFSIIDKKREKASNAISDFNTWRNDVFYTELFKDELKMYEEQEYPNADFAIETIDKHINNRKFFSKEDSEIYKKGTNYFLSKQKDKTSSKAKSDLLAYKVHLINSIAFYNYLTKVNALPEKHIFHYYFNYEFLNGESAIEP